MAAGFIAIAPSSINWLNVCRMGSDDIAHETPASALTEQIDDEAADIVTRHRRHRLATKARERVMLQCAQVERLSADAELPELRVRSEPAPRSLLERRRWRVVKDQVLSERQARLDLLGRCLRGPRTFPADADTLGLALPSVIR